MPGSPFYLTVRRAGAAQSSLELRDPKKKGPSNANARVRMVNLVIVLLDPSPSPIRARMTRHAVQNYFT